MKLTKEQAMDLMDSKGNLDLHYKPITKLPDNLTVGGWLDLQGTSITELPDNLTVGGWLNLRDTPITKLPDNLTVGGWLDLRDTSLTELPDNLRVGNTVFANKDLKSGELALMSKKTNTLPFGDQSKLIAPDLIDCSEMGYFDELEYECWNLVKQYAATFGIEIQPENPDDVDEEDDIDFCIAKAVQESVIAQFVDAGVKLYFGNSNKCEEITVICYNQKKIWNNRDEAVAFYSEAVMNTEGSEKERYSNVLAQLISGKKVCTDDEEDDFETKN